MKLRFPALILLVVLAGLLQHTTFLSFWGVKPNLVLAVLAALAVGGASFFEYLVLVILAALLLKYSATALMAAALLMFLIKRFLPWARFLNNLFLIFSGTFLFYLLASPQFLYLSWRITSLELIYNFVVGSVVLLILPKGEVHV